MLCMAALRRRKVPRRKSVRLYGVLRQSPLALDTPDLLNSRPNFVSRQAMAFPVNGWTRERNSEPLKRHRPTGVLSKDKQRRRHHPPFSAATAATASGLYQSAGPATTPTSQPSLSMKRLVGSP